MTKCDLTYEELVEDYEERTRNDKYFGVLMGALWAAVAMAIVNSLEMLARIGVPSLTAAYGVEGMTNFYSQMVHLAAVLVIAYIVYMWAVQTVYVYRDEIEDFVKRWKKFKLIEKKIEKMSEEL